MNAVFSSAHGTFSQIDHIRGHKAMTNIDSVLKSRDITFPTKVHIVKATVFPLVINGCECWTIDNKCF